MRPPPVLTEVVRMYLKKKLCCTVWNWIQSQCEASINKANLHSQLNCNISSNIHRLKKTAEVWT